jgi:hypothetical protein
MVLIDQTSVFVPRPVSPVGRHLRIEGDRHTVSLEGFSEPAQLAEGRAEVVLGQGEIGPHLERGAELHHGFGKLAQFMQRQPEVVGRLGVVWSQPQCGPAAVDGQHVVAEGTVRLGEVGVIGGGFGLQGHGLSDQLHGPGEIAILVVQNAKEMQGVGMVGLAREQGVIEASSIGEAARVVQLSGGFEFRIDRVLNHRTRLLDLVALPAQRRRPSSTRRGP